MKPVLVVDDAPIVRRYHRQILEGGGFAVDEAENGVDGLERALTVDPVAVVVDINMPLMDGCTLTRKLRARAETREVPIIMVTSQARPRDRDSALRAGANAYLVKPARPGDLMLHLRMLTGTRA